jgi:hypothetical protein
MQLRGASVGCLLIAVITAACASAHSNRAADASAAAGASGKASTRADAAVRAQADAADSDAGEASVSSEPDGGYLFLCPRAWYKCRDVCPGKFVLQGGGRRSGECQGECGFALTITPTIVLDEGSCIGTNGTLTVQSTAGANRSVLFSLTEPAWEKLARISLTLEGAQLAAVTGCPGCAGGAAAWIDTRQTVGGDPMSSRYELGAPPAALREADAFVQALIDQARVCRGELLEGCLSRDDKTRTPDGLLCGTEQYPLVTCACPADIAKRDGTVCDASCGSCSIHQDCGGKCIIPCAGGAPTWHVWCP